MVGGDALPSRARTTRWPTPSSGCGVSHLDGLPVLDGTVLRGVLTRRSIAAILHARAEAKGQAAVSGR